MDQGTVQGGVAPGQSSSQNAAPGSPNERNGEMGGSNQGVPPAMGAGTPQQQQQPPQSQLLGAPPPQRMSPADWLGGTQHQPETLVSAAPSPAHWAPQLTAGQGAEASESSSPEAYSWPGLTDGRAALSRHLREHLRAATAADAADSAATAVLSAQERLQLLQGRLHLLQGRLQHRAQVTGPELTTQGIQGSEKQQLQDSSDDGWSHHPSDGW